jgi:hypothetical protein
MIKQKFGKHIVSAFLLLVFLIIAIGSSDSKKPPDPNAWKSEDNRIAAYIMMERFVEQRLKCPGTAKFPGVWDGMQNHVTPIGNQTYKIVSYVDSQNLFGAYLRTNFVGEIQQMSVDNWRLISLNLLN